MAQRFDGSAWLGEEPLDEGLQVAGMTTAAGADDQGRFVAIWIWNLSTTVDAAYRSFVGGAWQTGDATRLPVKMQYDDPVLVGPNGFTMVIGYPGITAVRLQ